LTTDDVRTITWKAGDCLRQGLVDERTANKTMRVARRLLSGLRKELRGEVWDAELKASDIAELLEADRLLSRLLAGDGQVVQFPSKGAQCEFLEPPSETVHSRSNVIEFPNKE
jgi:hypothetical protein